MIVKSGLITQKPINNLNPTHNNQSSEESSVEMQRQILAQQEAERQAKINADIIKNQSKVCYLPSNFRL